MTNKPQHEDAPEFEGHYMLNDWKGCAYWILGWQLEYSEESIEEDEDGNTIYSEPELQRTGRLIVCMVGDDRFETCEPEELTPIEEDEFCPGCGAIGCACYS